MTSRAALFKKSTRKNQEFERFLCYGQEAAILDATISKYIPLSYFVTPNDQQDATAATAATDATAATSLGSSSGASGVGGRTPPPAHQQDAPTASPTRCHSNHSASSTYNKEAIMRILSCCSKAAQSRPIQNKSQSSNVTANSNKAKSG